MRFFLVIILVIILDQLTKYLAEARLAYAEPLAVLPSFNLTLLYNKGAAFGIYLGPYSRWIFLGLALVALVVLVAAGCGTRKPLPPPPESSAAAAVVAVVVGTGLPKSATTKLAANSASLPPTSIAASAA